MDAKNNIPSKYKKTLELKFDAVKYMRQQRDKISKELYGLASEQIHRHFESIKNSIDIRHRA